MQEGVHANLRVSFLRSSVTVVYTDIITPNATVVHTTAEDKVGGNTRPAHPHLRLLCMYLSYTLCRACSSVYTLHTLTADYIAEPSNRRQQVTAPDAMPSFNYILQTVLSLLLFPAIFTSSFSLFIVHQLPSFVLPLLSPLLMLFLFFFHHLSCLYLSLISICVFLFFSLSQIMCFSTCFISNDQ